MAPSAADPSKQFVLAARAIAAAARSSGIRIPSFMSPPRIDNENRTIQRRSDNDCVVAVLIRGRPIGDIISDMIEGVVVCNELSDTESEPVREALRDAVDAAIGEPASSIDHCRHGV